MFIILILLSVIMSTIMYLYLIYKTKISSKFLLIDNIIVIAFSLLLIALSYYILNIKNIFLSIVILGMLIVSLGFGLTMIRFWRTPKRKVRAKDNELISPADGNIIYIKKIEKHEIPISIKKGVEVKLEELTKTEIITGPCWLIGINMTPFDVHKNCSPISGEVIFNEHFNGKFLSLKDPNAITQNERQTIIVKNDSLMVGMVQTASRLVKRIDSYVKVGDHINKGDWYGMIRFGSQVDLIIPDDYNVNVNLKEQVYAAKTIIAKKDI